MKFAALQKEKLVDYVCRVIIPSVLQLDPVQSNLH